MLHESMRSRDGSAGSEPASDSPSVSQPSADAGAHADAVVDVEVLKRYIGDDAEAIAEFLTEFRKSVLHHAVELEQGVVAQDVLKVSRTSHTLKSTARAAGATAFGNVLAELETAAQRHDLEVIDRYYQEFRRLLPLVHARLNALVPAP